MRLIRSKYIRVTAAVIVLVAAGLAGLWLLGDQRDPIAKPPAAVDGTMDLSQWDFAGDGTVMLSGEWDFYWQQWKMVEDFAATSVLTADNRQIVNIPHVWTDVKREGEPLPGDGYATYRLRVLLPDDVETLAFRVPTLSTSCRIMVDDEEVASCGQTAATEEAAHAAYHPQVVSFDAHGGAMEIIVHISNYMYDRGGMWYALDLGLTEDVTRIRENMLSIDLILIGIFFFMGLYHVCIYLLRPSSRVALLFAIGCFIGAARLLVIDEIVILNWFPQLPLEWMIMVGYLTYYGGVAAITRYLYELYPHDVSKTVVHGVTVVAGAYMATVFFTPVSFFTSIIGSSHYLLIILMGYLLFCVYRALRRRRDGARLQFFGIMFFFLTILHDIIFNLYYIVDWLYEINAYQYFNKQIMVLGLFVLVFIQAIVLARRFEKSFEQAERMSERLITLNKMKDEFLFNTSHELKTPLHGMINLTQSMLEGATGKLTPKQHSQLSSIVSVSRRLSNLINDILDFYKLKHGEIHLERRQVSLQAVLQANRDIFRHFIADRPIQLVMDIPEELPKVYVDENRLLQIFYNLIGNAIKFTEKGVVTVAAMRREGEVIVSVSDTGIGIPEDKQQQIFQSFEHIGASVAREYGGTGLGLSITKRLVELSGGTLSVSSSLGEGSTFSFTLLVDASDDAAVRRPDSAALTRTEEEPTLLTSIQTVKPNRDVDGSLSPAHVNRETYTILAVDDDPTNLQVIISIFAQEPCRVLIAHDGAEALEMVESRRDIDLLVLDVMMPGLSGYEVCRTLRERFTLFELPVLLVTVKNEPEDLLHGFASGANDFLVKPFYSHELRGRVRTLLELKRSVEAAIRTEMAFLQAQIKPHFLFNALNTVVSICPRDPRKAVELLTELGDFLRGSFDFENQAKMVSLDKELQLTESYLIIEKARFAERLVVETDVQDELVCVLPPLTIQPLVENAVRHGIMSREDGGTVRLEIGTVPEGIRISVIDNGVGMNQETLDALHRTLKEPPSGGRHGGVGLKNIDTRLRRMYGEGLFIESEAGRGTKVSFVVPSVS